MSKPDTWMPLYIGDYRKDTSRLTTEQHGAYLLLIMDYWTNGPAPDDDAVLARVCLLELRAWRKMRPTIARFFQIEDGEWRHKRIDEEIGGAKERADKAADRARKAAEARWSGQQDRTAQRSPKSTASGNAPSMHQASLEECPSPSPSPSKEEAIASLSPGGDVAQLVLLPNEPTKPRRKIDYPQAFEALWLAYPHAQGRSSKSESLKEWEKLAADERTGLEASARRYGREGREPRMECGAPALERWLKRRLFENWPAPAAASVAGAAADPLAAWRMRLGKFVESRFWREQWGDQPRKDARPGPGVQVPDEILAEFGFPTRASRSAA